MSERTTSFPKPVPVEYSRILSALYFAAAVRIGMNIPDNSALVTPALWYFGLSTINRGWGATAGAIISVLSPLSLSAYQGFEYFTTGKFDSTSITFSMIGALATIALDQTTILADRFTRRVTTRLNAIGAPPRELRQIPHHPVEDDVSFWINWSKA